MAKQKFKITVECGGREWSKVSTRPYPFAVCSVQGCPQHWSMTRTAADALARDRYRTTCEKVVLETTVIPI